jgi:hypothetical protein
MKDWFDWTWRRHLSVTWRWALIATIASLLVWQWAQITTTIGQVQLVINSILTTIYALAAAGGQYAHFLAIFLTAAILYLVIAAASRPAERKAYRIWLVIGFALGTILFFVCLGLDEATLAEPGKSLIVTSWLIHGLIIGITIEHSEGLGEWKSAYFASTLGMGSCLLLGFGFFGSAIQTSLVEFAFLLTLGLGFVLTRMARILNQLSVWARVSNWLTAKPRLSTQDSR